MFCLYYVLKLTFAITVMPSIIYFAGVILRFFASVVFILGHQVTKSLKTSLELYSRFFYVYEISPSLSRASPLNLCQIFGSNSQNFGYLNVFAECF